MARDETMGVFLLCVSQETAEEAFPPVVDPDHRDPADDARSRRKLPPSTVHAGRPGL
jgi:hypothetical protein